MWLVQIHQRIGPATLICRGVFDRQGVRRVRGWLAADTSNIAFTAFAIYNGAQGSKTIK